METHPVVRAKFYVESKKQSSSGKNPDGSLALQTSIELRPVVGGSDENKAFFRWSPSGSIVLGCVNPAASDALEIGKEYYIDFTPAPQA